MGLFGYIFNIYNKNKKTKAKSLKENDMFKVEKLVYENFDIKTQYDFLKQVEEGLNEGLKDNEILKLSDECKNQLGHELPDDFKMFLKISNGFYGAGVRVLGKFNEDVQQKNPRASKNTFDILIWHDMGWEATNKYIILGIDSTSFIAYDVINKKYVIMSNGSSIVLKESDHFSLVFEQILKDNNIIK